MNSDKNVCLILLELAEIVSLLHCLRSQMKVCEPSLVFPLQQTCNNVYVCDLRFFLCLYRPINVNQRKGDLSSHAMFTQFAGGQCCAFPRLTTHLTPGRCSK